MSESIVDVAIIGGGPAGLAAALALVRARLTVALYDGGPARNAAAREIRGFLSQDGTSPQELRRIAREQLASYPGFVIDSPEPVERVDGVRDRFVVSTRRGSVIARRAMVCVGLVDMLPEVPGYRELWGTAVFQCPHCHGWEVRDQRFGYLAPDDDCVRWSLLLRAWTDDLIVFTGGAFEVPDELRRQLRGAGIALETRPIVALEHEGAGLRQVRLAGGDAIARDILFARPPQRQTMLVRRLVAEHGLLLDARDLVHISDDYETSVPGIYAAGDLMAPDHGALIAAANGVRAAHALIEELVRA